MVPVRTSSPNAVVTGRTVGADEVREPLAAVTLHLIKQICEIRIGVNNADETRTRCHEKS